MRTSTLIIFLLLGFLHEAIADVTTHVIDTGAGLATVTLFPNGDVMVYDTGHWTPQRRVAERFQAIIGDKDIDLLIVSHTDADHLAATDELFNNYRIHRVLRTGMHRPENRTNWRAHVRAVTSAANSGLTHDINLAETDLPFGTTFDFGDAQLQFLVGFEQPPEAWGFATGSADYNNAGSIVVRLSYKGNSLLFTGDAVGHHDKDINDAPAIATERFLIDHRTHRPIASDVMIAPHHGSNDASSTEFIEAVAARWVIFSAGHQHQHPRSAAVSRYLSAGYSPECLLRTDLGDDEAKVKSDGTVVDKEWKHGREAGHRDPTLDDEIKIVLPASGGPQVGYLGQAVIKCDQVVTATDIPEPVAQEVKKSRSNICHTPESSWYTRTKNYTAFSDLASCMASGGRVPN